MLQLDNRGSSSTKRQMDVAYDVDGGGGGRCGSYLAGATIRSSETMCQR